MILTPVAVDAFVETVNACVARTVVNAEQAVTVGKAIIRSVTCRVWCVTMLPVYNWVGIQTID